VAGRVDEAARAGIRVGFIAWVVAIVFSLVEGSLVAHNSFVSNLVFGLWAGAVVGVIAGLIRYLLARRVS
jgi:LytS/YehU family sensor histidine kinase